MKQQTPSPVAQWLIEECEARELSWAGASRRAGVDKSTISMIVRGHRPGLEACRALAAFFGVPTEHALRLAGHLSGGDDAPLLSPAVRDMALELERLPPEVQKPLLAVWRSVLDAMKAAAGVEEP